jgi:hypothetical protein
MFLAAILLPAAKPDTTLADTAARLGALVIVDGGLYQTGQSHVEVENAPAAPVQLFICADRVWALNSQQQPLLVIPTAQIISAVASESADDWIMRVRWAEHTADFRYRGIFAEHLSRVAESTLRSVIQPVLPVIPRKRAATAGPRAGHPPTAALANPHRQRSQHRHSSQSSQIPGSRPGPSRQKNRRPLLAARVPNLL